MFTSNGVFAQNAAQAAQVLQECNAVLGLPLTPHKSLVSCQLLPCCSQPPHSCAYQTLRGVPPSPQPHCGPEPVQKRLRFELVDGEPRSKQQPAPKRRKCTSFPTSLQQSANYQDQVVTDVQTEQAEDGSLDSSEQIPEHDEGVGTHPRPDGDQTDSMAVGEHKELIRCSHGPNSHTATTAQARLYSLDYEQPQLAAQPVESSHLIAQTPSAEPETSSKEVPAEVQQGTAADENPGVATQGDVSNSVALAMTPTMTSAQQNVLSGLMYHFCAKKGPSWLFL
ncbi:hypothetical protein ABBQ38_012984 [Trebouxia sp. C0009 RCD-2024]